MTENRAQISTLTISQVLNLNTKASAVFEKYQLDPVNFSEKTVRQASEEKGINTDDVVNDLAGIIDYQVEIPEKIDDWELDVIVDFIINNHHNYVRTMIPVITTHTEKVAEKFGKKYPETVEVARIFSSVYKELKQHMMKEEEILFPYIKYIVRVKDGEVKYEKPYFGRIGNPINLMELEHQSAGEDMYKIRGLLNNYTPPSDADKTFRLCVRELQEFEQDHLKHVHLENHLLFPKAVLLEDRLLEELNL